ncbi:hypothetical protein RHECNPAF_6420093 [Rhizobium etli CNPAF512]|nr:hypothetical protein RHECNPAF_6420093 [Rhizobium etli CNPAF512]
MNAAPLNAVVSSLPKSCNHIVGIGFFPRLAAAMQTDAHRPSQILSN